MESIFFDLLMGIFLSLKDHIGESFPPEIHEQLLAVLKLSVVRLHGFLVIPDLLTLE